MADRAWKNPIDGAALAHVPAGTFWMGNDRSGGRNADEKPAHRVRITRCFWIYRTEVTNAQYGEFLRATGHTTPAYWNNPELNQPEQPVVGVLAADSSGEAGRSGVEKYCQWAGCRLPTEAEWEYAARGGLEKKKYPWGDLLQPDARPAGNYWQQRNPGSDDTWSPAEDLGSDGFRGLAPVKQFPPNGYGLFDVGGNVWEWCADWFDPKYYASFINKLAVDPPGPPSSPTDDERVIRGGPAWFEPWPDVMRVSNRQGLTPYDLGELSKGVGFRPLMRSPPAE